MRRNWPAVAALILYLVVGTLYAFYTPMWQAPDEPAHYNYVQSLAEGDGFPVLEPGDYDQAYLSRLTTESFPPGLSVEPLEYEDHQPPLYYLLAVPIYWISDGSIIALRLFSLVLGGCALAALIWILREFWPDRPGIAWLGAGLVAFIPQFIAMMAAINNDPLTLALLWLWLALALRFLRGSASPWVLGGVLGALLLTKTTGYGALILAVLTVYLRYRREGQSPKWATLQLVRILLPALALGGLWWIRNAVVYGWPDLLGLIQHDAVVIGQPRSGDWIAQEGLLAFGLAALRTTFRSFWAQFGWMGVVVDARIYQALTVFSALVTWGAALRIAQASRTDADVRKRDTLVLLGASALITLFLFLGYNLSFVQHQGRYLFPALPIVALAGVLGLEHLLERRLAVGTALLLLGILILVAGGGLIGGDVSWWWVLLLAAAAISLAVASYLPRAMRPWLSIALVAAFVVLDLVCLFGFIVPMLA